MDVDVAIVGAGPAGLSLARALSGVGLRVRLIDQQALETLRDPPFDGREIALTPRSRRIMQSLGQWEHVAPANVSPLRRARVCDGDSAHALRITPQRVGETQLGWLVPNHAIRRAAFRAVENDASIVLSTGVMATSVEHGDDHATLHLSDGSRWTARLVVAADSRFSPLRRAAGISASLRDFGKSMMVCRMSLERPHDGEALEWFGHGQTRALLPLGEGQASVVLTLAPQDMKRVMEMDVASFNAESTQRFGHRFGAMTQISTRHVYPLVGVYAHRFVTQRFALVGDAAVGMHPLTAHGFNLGLRGVETLADLIRGATVRGQDIADASLLRRYEQAHRLATAPLYAATLAVVMLFTDDRPAARRIRPHLLAASHALSPFRRVMGRMLAADGGPSTSATHS